MVDRKMRQCYPSQPWRVLIAKGVSVAVIGAKQMTGAAAERLGPTLQVSTIIAVHTSKPKAYTDISGRK